MEDPLLFKRQTAHERSQRLRDYGTWRDKEAGLSSSRPLCGLLIEVCRSRDKSLVRT